MPTKVLHTSTKFTHPYHMINVMLERRCRPPSPLRSIPSANTVLASVGVGRSASPFRSLDRSNSLSRSSPFVSRSSSPAISVSSTSAARHLSRLSDAQVRYICVSLICIFSKKIYNIFISITPQVADLAGQISAEMVRRRSPSGALLAHYERLGLAAGH